MEHTDPGLVGVHYYVSREEGRGGMLSAIGTARGRIKSGDHHAGNDAPSQPHLTVRHTRHTRRASPVNPSTLHYNFLGSVFALCVLSLISLAFAVSTSFISQTCRLRCQWDISPLLDAVIMVSRVTLFRQITLSIHHPSPFPKVACAFLAAPLNAPSNAGCPLTLLTCRTRDRGRDRDRGRSRSRSRGKDSYRRPPSP